jgi:glucan endo-1,3-alpha-glucosidase
MYFIPDIDETDGYYGSSDAWWLVDDLTYAELFNGSIRNAHNWCRYYWGNITDGIFSWETAWPISSTRLGYGGWYAGDVTVDKQVIGAAKSRNKGYMIGLSALQYKNSYGANVYRGGELNLPTRMEGILNMEIQPDYVQIITWVSTLQNIQPPSIEDL